MNEVKPVAEVKAVASLHVFAYSGTKVYSAMPIEGHGRDMQPEIYPLILQSDHERAVAELRAEVSGLCLRIESLRLRKDTLMQLAAENLQRAEQAEARVAKAKALLHRLNGLNLDDAP